jgi:hypothetical protein
VLYFQKNGITTINNSSDILMITFILLSLFWLFYEINDYRKYQKRRRKIVSSPYLKTGNGFKHKQYYFNLRIVSNNKEFQIFDKNELEIYINKQKGQLEIFGAITRRVYSLKEIDFLVFEFLTTNLYTIKHDWGKKKWYCNFSIKLKKSKNLIQIAAMISDRDNLKEWGDFEEMDNNEFYYSQGLEIANILSSNMNTKYTVLNHIEGKMK